MRLSEGARRLVGIELDEVALQQRVEVRERVGPTRLPDKNQANENGTLNEVENEFHKTWQVDHRRNTDQT